MRLKEQYQELKLNNLYQVILIKSGNFYITFLEDALIFNYLFGYQIKDDKVGFPVNSINKVLFELRQYELNYQIVDLKEEKPIDYKEYSDEAYQRILQTAKKYEFEQSSNQMLLNRIQYLISINPHNYDKIKRFVDEL